VDESDDDEDESDDEEISSDSGSGSDSDEDSSEAEHPPKVTPSKSTKSKLPASTTPAKPKSNLDLLLDLDDSMFILLKFGHSKLSITNFHFSVSGNHSSHDPVPRRISDTNVNTLDSKNPALSRHPASQRNYFASNNIRAAEQNQFGGLRNQVPFHQSSPPLLANHDLG
jgi:hypothetical protein